MAERSGDRPGKSNGRAKAKSGMEPPGIRRAKKSLGVDKRRFDKAKQRAGVQGI